MENNDSNNSWKVKVDVFRGHVKGKLEVLEKYQDANTKMIEKVNESIEDLKIAIATHPQNCIQIEPIKEIRKDIQQFKDIETKRSVIKKLWMAVWGILGGGIGYLIALFIKNKFGGQ